MIGLRLSLPVRASKLPPSPPPFPTSSQVFFFYRSQGWSMRKAWWVRAGPHDAFWETIWGCSVPLCFFNSVFKQSTHFSSSSVSQKPVPYYTAVPWHSTRCLFLFFPLLYLGFCLPVPSSNQVSKHQPEGRNGAVRSSHPVRCFGAAGLPTKFAPTQ